MQRQILALAVGALVLMPAHASARQTAGTATGTIVGLATDASGAVLPGVHVTLSGDALMRLTTTATADDGRYRFVALSPGRYRLTFSRAGFASCEQDVFVGIGFTTTSDVTLEVAAQRETLIVSGPGRVLDRQSATLTEAFDSRVLEDLPASRSLGGLLAVAHAVQLSPVDFGGRTGIPGGAQSAYGKNSSPRHTIEGIIVTGLFGAGFALDYGSFEEALVLTGAHGAEWPTPGIHTQIVTKSGANRYRGTLFADYADRRWQSFNIDDGQAGQLDPAGGASVREANRQWSYHDVNGDVGGFVLKERLWWYSSVRDQEIATRLVNFPVRPSSTGLTNYSAKTTYRAAPAHTIVAYGQRGLNRQPYRLDPFGPAGSELSADTAINLTEDSTADQRNASWVWKGQWDAVVNESLVFEARAGQFGTDQLWKARGNRPRFEDVETLVVGGGNRDWHSDGRRNQFFGTLSYFRNGPRGSHHLKVGGEITRWLVSDAWLSGYPGDVLHVLRSGRPSAVFLFDTPTESRSGVWTYSAYASDSWRPGDRLSVNLGLRFDRYRVFLPAQEHPAGSATAQQFAAVQNLVDWNTLGPRISAVYDFTGSGQTLAKVALARYHVAPNANVGFSANPNPPQWWSQHTWTDANGSGVWEQGEEGPRRSQRGGMAIESLDPALELPVLNEVAAWLERELPAGLGLRTGLVWRGGHQHFARRNALQPFDAFTLPVALQDPGPDGATGSSDDGPVLGAYDLSPLIDTFSTANVVANVPQADTEYWTWEIVARRRFMTRWSFEAGFAKTWNRDHAQGYLGQALRNNAYPLTPNDLINADATGRHAFTTWTAKAHATYEALWGVRLTPVLLHQSGQPFGRTFTTDRSQIRYATLTVLAEPVGTRRMDNITLVDLRVEKGFRLAGDRRVAGILDIVNCFNANPAQNVVWASGPSFLQPVSIVPPRNVRVGVKFDW